MLLLCCAYLSNLPRASKSDLRSGYAFRGVYSHHNPLIFRDTVNTGIHSEFLQAVVMFDHLINSMKAIPLFSDTSRGPGAQLGSRTERSYISVLRPQIGS